MTGRLYFAGKLCLIGNQSGHNIVHYYHHNVVHGLEYSFNFLCTLVHLQVDVTTHRVEDNSIIFDTICSTVYLTQVYLSVVISSNTKNHSKRITCPSRQNVSTTLEPDDCNTTITVCGYWVLMNGSTYLDCPLNCTSIIFIQECPTSRSPG